MVPARAAEGSPGEETRPPPTDGLAGGPVLRPLRRTSGPGPDPSTAPGGHLLSLTPTPAAATGPQWQHDQG